MPCRRNPGGPHTWTVTKPTGRYLSCLGCGRTLKLADLEPWRRAAIIKGVQKPHGTHAAAVLTGQITQAQEAA